MRGPAEMPSLADPQRQFESRGYGRKSAYVCLEDGEVLYFPKLGFRLAMTRGSLIHWENLINADSEERVEDLWQTFVRLPRSDGGAPYLGLQATVFDFPLRDMWATAPPPPMPNP